MTEITAKFIGNGVFYKELAGISSEAKPVDNLATGSLFHEVDTTKVYAFNADADAGSEWVEQMAFGGDA